MSLRLDDEPNEILLRSVKQPGAASFLKYAHICRSALPRARPGRCVV
jgi:hypothetical protein